MNILPRTVRKIKMEIIFIMSGCLLGALYGGLLDGFSPKNMMLGASIAFLIGVIIATFEIFVFDERFRKLNFSTILILRTSFYLLVIVFSILLMDFSAKKFNSFDIIEGQHFILSVLFALFICFAINFLIMINRMLGKNVLLNFVLGNYHKPREEERIFMFLDLNSSTTIAEKIGHIKFHSFLNDFFFAVTEPIIETKGEIYQYVGDEIVVVWQMKNGLNNANCIRCFFEIEKKIQEVKDRFHKKFGIIPEFKAGLHCGKVVTGEAGDFKKEIMFIGDVVNTTARIRTECGSKGEKILVSKDLLEKLSFPENMKVESLGIIKMKGKEKEMELFSLRKETS